MTPKEGRYLIALPMRSQWDAVSRHSSGVAKAMPGQVWLTLGLGGRIPPLLDAFARAFCVILPWFDFFVMHPQSRFRRRLH
jgi:hypothetical protein